jgi:hypothetical protein
MAVYERCAQERYGGAMARRRQTAAEFIEANALVVPAILADVEEHMAHATQEWSDAVEATRRGDLETALSEVIEADIDFDIPLRVGRSGLRAVTSRADKLPETELRDDEAEDPT